jgi:hypothetical protein
MSDSPFRGFPDQNDSAVVLQNIRDTLTRLAAGLAGEMSFADDTLSLLSGKVRLTAAMYDDPAGSPAMAHCHVTTEIGNAGEPLDACVVGLHSERSKALAEVARVWVELVAAPILSLVHARPVLGAVHFDGSDPAGVLGAHGFVGPMGWRWAPPGFNPVTFGDVMLFDYAAEMAPPAVVHIAKTTLTACGEAGWRRNLEIDGHGAAHEEDRWALHVAAPPQGIGVQFAVFHFADQPHWLKQRQRLDDALYRFVTAFQETQSVDAAADILQHQGADSKLVNQIAALAPLAAGRVLYSATGARFPPEFMRARADGSLEEGLLLMRQPVFARGKALFAMLMGGEHAEAVQNLALTGAELHAISGALHAGSELEDLELAPPIVFDVDVSDEAVEAATAKLRSRRPQRGASPKSQKPWWRFW